MKEFVENAKLGFRAALNDTAEHLFHPIHNLKVVFGVVQEDSLREVLRKMAEKDKKEQTAQPSS